MGNEEMISNEEKRQVYAILKTKLKIAMDQEFYLEALLLEYSIVEDRLLSILKHLGLKYTESDGKELMIGKKIKKIRSQIENKNSLLIGKTDSALLDRIFAWKKTRNDLVHNSCHRLFDNEEVTQCADEGEEIVRLLSNSAARIKRAADRRNAGKQLKE